jgi:acetyltransferase-like isoleucine patch superfamily enzyme
MKRLLLMFLAPFARLAQALEPLHRLWAHARLSARIRNPAAASIVVQGPVEIHGTGQIRLGGGLFLYRDLYFETQEQGSITIGERVVISRGTHIVSWAAVEIGDDSMIGEYVSIRDANHIHGEKQPLRSAGHRASAIVIGRNVWVARGVTVLPGVHIGDNAVVGANAVVTRNVPPGAVVVGIPARPIAASAAS